MSAVCIRCKGRIVSGQCKGCGRRVNGAMAVLDDARARIRERREARVAGCSVPEGRVPLDVWIEAVEACGCALHRGEPAREAIKRTKGKR